MSFFRSSTLHRSWRHAPSDNRDLVVDHWEKFVLRVDATSVSLEFVSNFDTACDWSVLVKIGLHLLSTSQAVVVGSIVVFVVNSPAFVLAGLVLWAWWPGAVLALVDGTAGHLVKVVSDVCSQEESGIPSLWANS